VILKDKMNRLITGETPDPSLYDRILTWPEVWDDKTMYSTYRREVWNPEIHKEKLKEHEVMHTVRWAARNPRWAFEKLEKRTEQAREDEENQEVAEVEMEEEEVPEDATEVPETADAIFNEGEPDTGMPIRAEDQGEEAVQEIFDEEEDEDAMFDADESDSDGPLAVEEPKGNKSPFGGLYK
jgi:general transcription factor 3C polypeptide 5 (transcription factor C subunit 1)